MLAARFKPSTPRACTVAWRTLWFLQLLGSAGPAAAVSREDSTAKGAAPHIPLVRRVSPPSSLVHTALEPQQRHAENSAWPRLPDSGMPGSSLLTNGLEASRGRDSERNGASSNIVSHAIPAEEPDGPGGSGASFYCRVGQWPTADLQGLTGDARYRCTEEGAEIVKTDEAVERRIPVGGECWVQCNEDGGYKPAAESIKCVQEGAGTVARFAEEPRCVNPHRRLKQAGLAAAVAAALLGAFLAIQGAKAKPGLEEGGPGAAFEPQVSDPANPVFAPAGKARATQKSVRMKSVAATAKAGAAAPTAPPAGPGSPPQAAMANAGAASPAASPPEPGSPRRVRKSASKKGAAKSKRKSTKKREEPSAVLLDTAPVQQGAFFAEGSPAGVAAEVEASQPARDPAEQPQDAAEQPQFAAERTEEVAAA
eukprot:TRINITY_DN41755_c0_g1_i1.p1 TRINITY_DN41755_c0_g1~~TRINITY_DN41755_c0_g1_i1.p1  ORF type:complete len:424 (-),score=77.82 TRINITY_DN41755_c0_g1_i1:30-1301(-)